MRAPLHLAVLLAMLGSLGCAGPLAVPLAVAPLAAAALGPHVLAAPNEDGSVYVLAEGGPTTSTTRLKSLWRRKAAETCEGDYLSLSEGAAQSRRGGLVGRSLYEGFVRCVSPEGGKPE